MRDDVDDANQLIPVRDTELQLALDRRKEASSCQTNLRTMNEREEVRSKLLDRGRCPLVPELLEVGAPCEEPASTEPGLDELPDVPEILCRPRRERGCALQDGFSIAAISFFEHSVEKLAEPLLDRP
jgi:hypothetical protein